jgi:hypothetical protein
MTTTIVIVNIAFISLVVGVIVGLFLWAIKTSPSQAQILAVAREPQSIRREPARARATNQPALDR